VAGNKLVNTIYCFDTETLTVSTLNTVLPTAYSNIGGANFGDYIYLFGGYPSNKNILKFDCKTETLITLPSLMLLSGNGIAAVALDSGIYLFGGYYGSSSNKIYFFDIESETVVETLTLLPRADYNLCCAATEDHIYITGGEQTGSKDISRFTPAMSIIVEVDNMQIQSTLNKNKFNLINTNKAQVEIGVNAVYKGNSEGIGELVEASLHNGTTWVKI
jgi:N-acetylneuraminic acid mutarotase